MHALFFVLASRPYKEIQIISQTSFFLNTLSLLEADTVDLNWMGVLFFFSFFPNFYFSFILFFLKKEVPGLKNLRFMLLSCQPTPAPDALILCYLVTLQLLVFLLYESF